MKANKTEFLKEKLEKMEEQGETWIIRNLDGPTKPHVSVEGKECIMMASNNYLNLANDPRLREAAKEAIDKYGAGAGSDWSIAGSMKIHDELNKKIAEFKGTESAVIFQTGYAVNAGVLPQIIDKGDLVISDQLNHGSIIDGIRLAKAERAVYGHSTMAELESILQESQGKYKRTLIVTDGVFSMDGDIAKMGEIQKLADEYDALTYVDDAHGEGVLGGGHGIAAEFNLGDKINFQMGTFSKAFGSFGGMLAGNKEVVEYAYNTARTWLLSAAFPPHIAAVSKRALEIVEEEPERVKKLWDNTRYFKKEIESLGYDTGKSQTPIVPAMIGDSKKAQEVAKGLYEGGIFSLAIVFPMVAKGQARIRNQLNTDHSREDLDRVLSVYEKLGKSLKLI